MGFIGGGGGSEGLLEASSKGLSIIAHAQRQFPLEGGGLQPENRLLRGPVNN